LRRLLADFRFQPIADTLRLSGHTVEAGARRS
jgi:hypothetical protein